MITERKLSRYLERHGVSVVSYHITSKTHVEVTVEFQENIYTVRVSCTPKKDDAALRECWNDIKRKARGVYQQNLYGHALHVLLSPIELYRNFQTTQRGTHMSTLPRNYMLKNVELNWAKLARPVKTPFGNEQYELQVATTDAAVAKEWSENHIKVTEKDGKYVAQLKRKALKANGDDNGAPRVVDSSKTALENPAIVGNGSVGNVIVFQYEYSYAGKTDVATSLTAIQVVELVEYTGAAGGMDFDDLAGGSSEPSEDPASASSMFQYALEWTSQWRPLNLMNRQGGIMKNLVAKYARSFNKASVQKDRKKDSKRGYQKHKGVRYA